ncbi:MAG: YdcF family protein, partial [Prochlorococcaceae cyanobacterium]
MAYWLSKLLPLALLPLGLSLILLLVGLIGRWRWPVITAGLMLWFFSLGLVSQSLWRWLEVPWQRRMAMDAPQADAIVVLSGGRHPAPGSARFSEWHDPDRFLAGVDLFRAGKAPRLLFTGGASPFSPGQHPEGQHYLQEAALLGVPEAAMASTPPVVNTAEEARAIRRLLPASQSRVLLVTSAFHMRRSQRLFERQGLQVLPFPVDFQARGRWAGPLWRDPTQ